VSTDQKFRRNFDKLTTEYVRDRLERLDQQIQDLANIARLEYLSEQRAWWEKQLVICQRREGYPLPAESLQVSEQSA
jgi:hypothetical protein